MANQPDVRIRLTAEGVKEVVQALQQVQAQANKSAQQTNKVSGGFDATTKSVAALKGAVGALAAAAAGLVALDKMREWAAYGLEVNGAFEKAQGSLAGVLASQAKLVDSSGNVLKGQDAYAAAVQLSADYMAGLQEKAAAAGVDYASLAKQSSLLVFTGLNAGVKDMDKLQELTVLSAAMMRTFGEDTEATSEQLKNLLRGEGSDISDALGINDDMLKRWKMQGTLVDEVIKRLNTIEAATKAYANSWDGVKGKMKAAFEQLTGGAFSGMFEKLKTGLGSTVDGLYEKAGKLRPEVQAVADVFSKIGGTLGGAIAEGAQALVNGVKSAGLWLQKNSGLVAAIGTGFNNAAKAVGSVLDATGKLAGEMGLMKGIAGAIALSFNGMAITIAGAKAVIASILKMTASTEAEKVHYDNEIAGSKKSIEMYAQQSRDVLKMVASPNGSAAADAAGSQGGTAAGSTPAKGKAGAKVAGTANKHILTPEEIAAAKAKEEARAQMAIAENDRMAKLALIGEKAKAAIAQEGYDQGKLALEDYNKARLADIEAEADAELKVLQAQLDRASNMKTFTPEEENQKKLAIYQTQTAIDTRKAQRDADLAAQERKFKQDKLDLEAQVKKIEADIAEKYGERGAAAKVALDAEIKATEQLLTKQGMQREDLEKTINKLRELGTAAINFDKANGQVDDINAKYDLQRKGVEVKQAAGSIWNVEAERQLAEIEKQRLADLEAAARTLTEVANGEGGTDEMKRKAEEMNLTVQQLRGSTDQYSIAGKRLRDTFESSIADGLNGFFDNIISGSMSAEDAFRSFAAGVVDSIRKIAQELLVRQIVMQLFGAASGGGSLGSLFSSAAAGSSGGVSSIASVASVGQSTGYMSVGAYADGGYISGPGTATSDSIPAMLSNGEYVIRAAAVQSLGVGLLDMLNRNGSLHPVLANKYALGGIQKYADGGLVGSLQGSQQGGGESSLTVGLDDGLVLKKLSSPEGHKLIVEAIGNNRRAVRQIIG